MSESTKTHKTEAPKRLRFAIFTCSSSRYQQVRKGQKAQDASGDLIEFLLKKDGHAIMLRKTIPDDKAQIEQSLRSVLGSNEVDAAVFCGGTGITSTDVTIETVTPFLEKVLHGFGEIFRRLSYDEIGSSAILSRALAGAANGKAVFCVPGSPNAVRLCLEKLILPETGHIVRHARE